VATLSAQGYPYDGHLDGLFKQLPKQVLDIYANRRPRVLVVDDNALSHASQDLQKVGLNPVILDIRQSNKAWRQKKYRSFDMILASQDVDPSTLRIISNEGAPPIFLYTDVPPSDQYGLDEAQDLVRDRLVHNYGHCSNVVGVICPRADYHLVSQVAHQLVSTGSIGLPEDQLDIDLTRGAGIRPAQVIEKKGPYPKDAKVVYRTRA
jgi:hypothetical protein